MRLVSVVGAAVAAAMLHSFLARPDVGLSLGAATVLAVAISARKPADGLLLVAGLGPLGAAVSGLAGVGVSWTGPLAVAVLLGAAVNTLAVSTPSSPVMPRGLRLAAPAFVILVMGSWVAQVAVEAASLEHPPDVAARVLRSLWQEFFARRHASLQTAVLHLECVALLWLAAREASRRVDAGRGMLLMGLAGATAAAAQSLLRLAGSALRTEVPWATAFDLLRRTRIVAAFPDSNASGSFFVLAFGLAAWCALGQGWRRAAGSAAAALMLLGIWLAGSRSAVAALALALAVVTAVAVSRPGWRWRWLRLAAPPLIVGAAALLLSVAEQHNRRQVDPAVASIIRVEFAYTTARMVKAHPWAGVGIGRYLPESTRYGSPRLRSYYERQNAHNQFLQELGELGIPGFVAFCGLLAAAGGPTWRAWRREPRSPRAGVVIGLLGFVLTWVSGHPLLVPGVAYAFFLTLGAALGTELGLRSSPPPERQPGAPSDRRLQYAVVAAALLVLPLEGWWGWRSAVHQRGGLGVSGWATGADGRAYRSFLGKATVFADARGPRLDVPLRLPDQRPPAIVEFAIDGMRFMAVRIDAAEWTINAVRVPRRAAGRTVAIELTARDAGTGADAEVLVGRVGAPR